MAIRRHRRGISLGTVCVLSLCAVALLAGGLILSRISGDMIDIAIGPNFLTEPLMVLVRSVSDVVTERGGAEQRNARQEPPSAPTGEDAGGSGVVFSAETKEPAPRNTPTPAPTPLPSRTLTLTAVGQVSIGTELRANAAASGGVFNFYDMVSSVADELTGADLSIVTLRTGLWDGASDFDNYRAPASLVDGLRAAGLNLFNFATDRVLDHGGAGVNDTRTILENKNTTFSGIYRSGEERSRPAIADIGGVKIGLLSYTASLSAAGKSAVSENDANVYTRVLSTEQAAEEVAALRRAGAEIVIALPFWGSRSDAKPSRETQAEADALIAAGADIILGAGPTSVHEVERRSVSAADGGVREALIAYSLGNFLIDDSRDTANITGMILSLSFTWDGQAQKVSLGEAWYLPTWIMRWQDASGINRYRVVPAGTSTIPEGMTESIYINMKKAYQGLVNKLGNEAARARAE